MQRTSRTSVRSRLSALEAEIRACRLCVEAPKGRPLAHDPRPVLQVSSTARIAICGQAPGTRVHASGQPFTDPSGDRLRSWLGMPAEEFYDASRIAIVPMGFCFPGLDANGGDLPPRRECAPRWRQAVFDLLPDLRLIILVGLYAQRWHIRGRATSSLTDNVKSWRVLASPTGGRKHYPLPHPSWRNNSWLRKHPWFEADLLPELRADVAQTLSD